MKEGIKLLLASKYTVSLNRIVFSLNTYIGKLELCNIYCNILLVIF